MSKKLNLPRLEDQLLKFAHLRYKVIPLPRNEDTYDEEVEQFFKEVDLPRTTIFVMGADDFIDAVIFPNGGITAAFKIDPSNAIADIGIAKCNLSDTYNKQEGRCRSNGRFSKERASTKNTHFETFFRLDLSDVIDPEIPISATVRNIIIDGVTNGSNSDVERDMAIIRGIIAVRTKVAFYVELS
jgi:hypothetical protein